MKFLQFLFIFFLSLQGFQCLAQETYLDRFNTVSYANNNGSQNFSSNWIETGDTNNGPNSQYVRITGNRLELYYLYSETIRRTANLTGASSAILSFDWQSVSLGGGRDLAVQVSNNGGASYTTIATITGNTNGNFTQDISGFISNNTTIRFIKSFYNWRSNDYAYIDNFQITATFPAPIPVIEVDDVSVNENDGSVSFTVNHTGTNAGSPFSVNYQLVDGSANAGSDYSNSTGVLNFNGTAGDSEIVTVSILDDSVIENPEEFMLQFTVVTDPSVDISDTATATIIDDDALIMTNGQSVTTCSDTFFDPGGLNNYNNNEDIVYTICPDTADTYLNIDFTSFEVVSGDVLYIYDGNSTSGNLIGQYDSSNVPTSINSNAANGCLTFRFVSNGSSTGAGWEAEVNCFPEGPIIIIDDISFDEDVGNAVFTVRSTRAAHGRNIFLFGFVEEPFTVDFQTVDGTATAGSDYTNSSGTLTFTGELNNIQTISVPIANDGIPELAESFTIEFTDAEADYAQVNYNDIGTGTINSQILANDPLTLFQEFDGYYDYSTTGGTLRTSPNGGDPCAITTTSSNSLVSPVPATASVERAYLYWSHSSTVRDADVTFEGQSVSANLLYQTSLGNRNFYGYVSDVTAIVQGVTNLSSNIFDFSDLDINNTGDYCSTSTVLGGWALMVFYEDRSLPAVNINLYQGFDGLSNEGTSFTLDSFYAISGTGAKATFLSWEGDPDLTGASSGSTNPEELSITNQRNQNNILSGDGGQPGNNSYNSTIYDNTVGPVYNNTATYGLDLDTYDISSYIQPADSEVTANVDVGQDFVISAAVVLKVPSNLIAGRVFEDVNYPGGLGRDRVTANGTGITGAVVELFESNGTFIQRKNTAANGSYSFGGMADGDYYIKVVSSTVRSTRDNGANCSSCYPVQTFRAELATDGNYNEIRNEVGGTDPAAFQDVALGVFSNAQSISPVTVEGNGVVDIDFGFNFNTIVNTNELGQGSLEQFIRNSNTLGETGLDIEPNAIFDPLTGEDTSIFMIPPTGDALGRTADANYQPAGYFDIHIDNSNTLTDVTGTNTVIDGRTQTAYSSDSNSGLLGSGGTGVGVSNAILPNYERPEIQVHRNGGDLLDLNGPNVTVRNLSVYANNNAGIRILGGTATVSSNLLGVNALGIASGNINFGIEQTSGEAIIEGNFISSNTNAGILINGGNATRVELNHLIANGNTACDGNILISGGSNVQIEENLMEDAAAAAIHIDGVDDVIITNNSISDSGQNGANCTGFYKGMGIYLDASGSIISQNVIFSNGSQGIAAISGNNNTFSQNSIYANGTNIQSLGIDLNHDGVTLNDNGDVDSGPNDLLNFPVISGAYISGSFLIVEGWSRPGATIEVFLTDVSEGTAATGDNRLGLSTDYGEGQLYLGTFFEGSTNDFNSQINSYLDEDGNTDNTNKFKFRMPLPSGAAFGKFVTATATVSNTTSEFSPESIIRAYTIITNRRITYRVKRN
ncbi:Calx-beta domain-containing protein [Cytophaga sp. FL35]|uniref:Calx-beta domain-containing protein n=1 Tax=Cytophaga sp. FL35 TaxID=1904456 RepID=UPI00165371F4|nr:Calx-beta domain-containing protein [Cytophaga sp. FL35]MBC6999594.1 right-handed parallel beta-helix repeat-containing protein [Cytophaga sp. FL35]